MEIIGEFDFNPLVPGVVYIPFRVFRKRLRWYIYPINQKLVEIVYRIIFLCCCRKLLDRLFLLTFDWLGIYTASSCFAIYSKWHVYHARQQRVKWNLWLGEQLEEGLVQIILYGTFFLIWWNGLVRNLFFSYSWVVQYETSGTKPLFQLSKKGLVSNLIFYETKKGSYRVSRWRTFLGSVKKLFFRVYIFYQF